MYFAANSALSLGGALGVARAHRVGRHGQLPQSDLVHAERLDDPGGHGGVRAERTANGHSASGEADSPAEESGFEPSVAPRIEDALEIVPFASAALPLPPERSTRFARGTGSSNLPSSSGESFRLARSIGSQTTFAPCAGSVSSNANRAKHPAVPRPYLGVGDWILPRTRASACMC
jgi:hypothetical protein